MRITITDLSTTRGRYKYLFFLLVEDYVQEQQEIPNALRASLENFARDLQNEAALVRPFAGDIEATRRQVLGKPWPGFAEQEIQSTPCLLMIDRDFDIFDTQASVAPDWDSSATTRGRNVSDARKSDAVGVGHGDA